MVVREEEGVDAERGFCNAYLDLNDGIQTTFYPPFSPVSTSATQVSRKTYFSLPLDIIAGTCVLKKT
ncbi:hypothetical protein VYU27_004901 [Nannochloropsis oceanica]